MDSQWITQWGVWRLSTTGCADFFPNTNFKILCIYYISILTGKKISKNDSCEWLTIAFQLRLSCCFTLNITISVGTVYVTALFHWVCPLRNTHVISLIAMCVVSPDACCFIRDVLIPLWKSIYMEWAVSHESPRESRKNGFWKSASIWKINWKMYSDKIFRSKWKS